KQNSNRPYKTGAECRHEYSIKRYDKCVVHIHCSCSYIDLEDVCDECLPTKEMCMQNRRSLEIKDRNGIIIEKYIFGDLNKKIGSRKRTRDRTEEETADDISIISNDDNHFGHGITSSNPENSKLYNDVKFFGKRGTAYSILKKNPNLFMKASQLKALEQGRRGSDLVKVWESMGYGDIITDTNDL
ncbi:25502_t:CDS:2, partial [Racocetra persica]